MINNIILLFLILINGFWFAGCSQYQQFKEYTTYQLHDIRVESDDINILLEKKRFSPKISNNNSIFAKINTENKYRLISYANIVFNKKDISENNENILNKINKINIIDRKNIFYSNRIYFIDSNRIISWSDFVNDNPHMSIIFLDNSKKNIPITNSDYTIYYCNSFDNKKILYLHDNKMFIYDTHKYEYHEFLDNNLNNVYSSKFENTKYMAENGKWFFEHIADDVDTMSFVFQLVDKKEDLVLSKFISKSNNFQDFNNKLEGGKLLTYDHRYGLEIIDLKGNSLYSLQDESLKYTSRAVLHEDKVYAAGITTRDSPLGKKEYIEIIQWDYKNDSVIKKYYPCDSPELEM